MSKQKKAAVVTISYLTAAVIALGVTTGVYYRRARQAELVMHNGYQRAFNELVTAVEEVDAALQKSVYALSPDLTGTLCTEIFGKAMTAQMSLAALPFAAQELEQTSDFISRIGDYAFSLSRRASAGQNLTEEEKENLMRLSDNASILALNLKGMQTELQEGRLSLTELRQGAAALTGAPGSAPFAGDSIRMIEQEFPEIPTLIYDGPFSQHLVGAAPLGLEGQPELTVGEARDAAARFLGVGKGKIYPQGECAGELPCWRFASDGEEGSSVYLSVTKQGGKILSMLSSRPVGTAAVDQTAAVETAKQFLQDSGYTGMAETYHMTQRGILTVNFAYRQGEVLCYPDLIKVSVALDTGRVCGFEAGGYLASHRERDLPEALVSEEEARAMVPAALEELAHQLALIPSAGKNEILCHEFKCAAEDGRHYIIYVNAATGAQEKILILLEDASGALTL